MLNLSTVDLSTTIQNGQLRKCCPLRRSSLIAEFFRIRLITMTITLVGRMATSADIERDINREILSLKSGVDIIEDIDAAAAK